MDAKELEAFITTEFPMGYRALIPGILREAYNAVDELYLEHPIFKIKTAVKGHVLNWAIDFQMKKIIESGVFPFEYSYKDYDVPTGKYMLIHLHNSTLSIHQVDHHTSLPRHSVYRNNLSFNNAPYLDLDGFQAEQEAKNKPHLIMTHGYKELSFCRLGMPHPVYKTSWLHKSLNLLSLPHIVRLNSTAEPNNTEATVTLKEELIRKSKDDGHK